MNRLPSYNSSTPSTAASSDLEDQVLSSDGGGDDGCSLASDVPSLENSVSDGSDGSSSGQDTVPPLSNRAATPRKPRFLRHRNSGLNSNNNNNDPINSSSALDLAGMDTPPAPLLPGNSNGTSSSIGGGNSSVPAVGDFIPQFLLPQNLNAPLPKGPVRKHSDFEQVAYKGIDVEYNSNNNVGNSSCGDVEPHNKSNASNAADAGIGRFRTREEIVLHFIMELNMLRRDALIIIFGVLMQWFHSILTNLAYYYHTQLTAAQRIPLKDLAYDTLPMLEGQWWMVSEYLFLCMLVTLIVSIASILVIRWNPPHGRPLYCIPICRRLFMTLSCCQVLRCVSFLITTLPGASRQCLYDIPEDMSREELVLGPAHDRGNPTGWAPPITMNDIIWRLDATNGCGDLMFSSHTIFTMLFVCIIWRYFNWGFLKYGMLTLQVRTNVILDDGSKR